MRLGIILGVLLFVFLVIIHELGHFFAAKKAGVQVLEFGIGIPPKLFTLGRDKSGTEYTLNAIPLGGFVRLKGENPGNPEAFYAKDSFISANFWKKTVILLAGVFVNFLFAWGVLTILFTRGMSPLGIVTGESDTRSYLTPSIEFLQEKGLLSDDVLKAGITIDEIAKNGFADDLGLQIGDRILKIDSIPIGPFNLTEVLREVDGEVFIEIERQEELIHLEGSCVGKGSKPCVLGIAYVQDPSLFENISFQFSLWKSMKISFYELYEQGRLTLHKLGSIIQSLVSGDKTQRQEELSGLTGPVGAVKIGEFLVNQHRRSEFLAFGAMISFALAIFNILPIPALDGGRLLGVIIQKIFFRRKIEKYFAIEGVINFVFFALLMLFGVYIILKDLVTMRGVSIRFIT